MDRKRYCLTWDTYELMSDRFTVVNLVESPRIEVILFKWKRTSVKLVSNAS